jgi:hypothetical protein
MINKLELMQLVEQALDKQENVLLITTSERDITVVCNFDREHVGDFIISLAEAFGGGGETVH